MSNSPPISVRSHHSALSDLNLVNNDSILGHYSEDTQSQQSDSSSEDGDDESELSNSNRSSSLGSSSTQSSKQKMSTAPVVRKINIPKKKKQVRTTVPVSMPPSTIPIIRQNVRSIPPPPLKRVIPPDQKLQNHINRHEQKRTARKKAYMSPLPSEPPESSTYSDDDNATVSHDYESDDRSGGDSATDQSDVASAITVLSAAAGSAAALAAMPKKQRKKVGSMLSLCVGTVAIVTVVYIAYRMWSKIHHMKDQIEKLKCEIESSIAGGPMDHQEIEDIARKQIERILDEPIDPNVNKIVQQIPKIISASSGTDHADSQPSMSSPVIIPQPDSSVPDSVLETERQMMPKPIYPTSSITQPNQDPGIHVDMQSDSTDISPDMSQVTQIQDTPQASTSQEAPQIIPLTQAQPEPATTMSAGEIMIAGQQASAPPSSIGDVISAIETPVDDSSNVTNIVDDIMTADSNTIIPSVVNTPVVEPETRPATVAATTIKTKAAKPTRRKVPAITLKNDNKLTGLANTLTDETPAQAVVVPELKSLSTTLHEQAEAK